MELTRPQHDCIAKYFAHYNLILEENGLKQRSANYCGLISIHFHNLICYVHGQTIPVNNLTTDQNKQFKDGHWSFLEVIINHNKSQYSDSDPPAPIKLGLGLTLYVLCLSACLGICRKKLDCLCRWFRVKLSYCQMNLMLPLDISQPGQI